LGIFQLWRHVDQQLQHVDHEWRKRPKSDRHGCHLVIDMIRMSDRHVRISDLIHENTHLGNLMVLYLKIIILIMSFIGGGMQPIRLTQMILSILGIKY